jgi:hypothetical protein
VEVLAPHRNSLRTPALVPPLSAKLRSQRHTVLVRCTLPMKAHCTLRPSIVDMSGNASSRVASHVASHVAPLALRGIPFAPLRLPLALRGIPFAPLRLPLALLGIPSPTSHRRCFVGFPPLRFGHAALRLRMSTAGSFVAECRLPGREYTQRTN